MSEMSTNWATEYEVAPVILATLKNLFELIWNYFVERSTNVFTEGVNNKIKLIKRRTFGFINFDYFRLSILVEFAPNST